MKTTGTGRKPTNDNSRILTVWPITPNESEAIWTIGPLDQRDVTREYLILPVVPLIFSFSNRFCGLADQPMHRTLIPPRTICAQPNGRVEL
jgi:hypothetical protein